MREKDQVIRCPRLGGQVPFRYCETSGSQGRPCFKVADCWWQSFDVVGYLKKKYTVEELRQVLERRPQPRLSGILEQIAAARRNTPSEGRDG